MRIVWVVGRTTTQLKEIIMRTSIIKSNIEVHGHKFAVEREVQRFMRKGCSRERAISIALQLVFGRVVL